MIVRNVAPTGYAVLNAADPNVAAMATSCPGSVIFFTADRQHPVMATHRAQGKRTVYVDQDEVVAASSTASASRCATLQITRCCCITSRSTT